MRWIFEPAIRVLMHWRNFVKMPLAGGVFCVPLAIAVFARPTEWTSAWGIALAVTFVLAWYYIGAMFFTSDEHATFVPGEAGRPRVGDRVRLWPAHVDPTVACHERMWLVRGDEIVDRWDVDLRNW